MRSQSHGEHDGHKVGPVAAVKRWHVRLEPAARVVQDAAQDDAEGCEVAGAHVAVAAALQELQRLQGVQED